MNPTVRRTTLVSATAVAALTLAGLAGPAAAGRKSKPACGISYLPLVTGNMWTYEPVDPPVPLSEADNERLTKAKQMNPPPPKQVVITVLSVEDEKGGSVITLEEKADTFTRKTVLHCTKKGLDIDPQSFFFAAEPGGGLGMTLTDVQRDGSLPGSSGFRKGKSSTVSIKANLERKAAEGTGAEIKNGKVEIERTVFPGITESVSTPAGEFRKAARVEFDLTGRAAVEPNIEKFYEIKIDWRGIFWFQNGVGLVQARNRSGIWYQLTAYESK